MSLSIDVDGTLKRWSAPRRAESFWEERADAVVRAALTENKNAELLNALMAAPPLAREPGEPSALREGEAAAPRSQRPSLREMAEQHAGRVLLLKKQKEAAARGRAAGQNVFDDVGKSVAAPSRAPAPRTKTAEPAASTAASASASSAAAAKPLAMKKSYGGFIAGVAVAALGISAALAIGQRDRLTPPSMPPAPALAEARRDGPAEPPASELSPPPATVAQAEPPAERPAAPPAPMAKAPRSDSAAPLPRASTAPEPAQAPSTVATTAEVKPAPTGTGGPEDPGGIEDEDALRDRSRPADSGDPSSTIPQQPAPGAVSAALRPVLGSAKKCVAGADDVSRATITFSSDGTVKSVVVTGWAASNGATGCVTSALKGANVGRFWKASFTASATIQP